MFYSALLTIVSVGLLLMAGHQGWHVATAVFKALASTGFILFAIFSGALTTGYGRLILAGLVLSWFGDAFLLARSDGYFQAGLASFLFAHIAYSAAFYLRGISPLSAIATLALLIVVGILVLRWLYPHVPSNLRLPVEAYILAISVMVTLAGGTFGVHRSYFLLVGAVVFFVSDIFVARDRFVSPGCINSLCGLPLYYAGQLLLAYSCTFR